MRDISSIAGLTVMAVILSGCATTKPVVVRGDNYCRLTRQISWVPADTRMTIDQIRVHNTKRARVCGRRK